MDVIDSYDCRGYGDNLVGKCTSLFNAILSFLHLIFVPLLQRLNKSLFADKKQNILNMIGGIYLLFSVCFCYYVVTNLIFKIIALAMLYMLGKQEKI